MGNNFVDDAVRERMKACNLATGTADTQALNFNLGFRVWNFAFYLLQNGTIALPRSPHRVPAGSQIDRCKQCIVGLPHQNGLGGG